MDLQESIMSYGLILYYYLTLINLFGFVIMGWDKNRAEKQRGRTSENQLILIGLMGGSIGIAFGMLIFRHKTAKKKFYIGIPGIYIIQWTILLGLIYYFIK